MINHASKTFALVEVDFPFHVKVEESQDFDIKSVGYDDFDGQLKHNVSAHPKVCPLSGDLYAFGYDMNQGALHFSVIDKHRRILVSDQIIKITSPRMIHDFMITENYVIFPDLPMEFNPPKAVKNKGFVF